MTKPTLATTLIVVALAAGALAQQPPAGQPPQGQAAAARPAPAPRSAEVASDGRVTFRVNAPKAGQVVLNGDWPGGRGLSMTKDASGTWTLTTDPLTPEIWMYTLLDRRRDDARPRQLRASFATACGG